LFSCKTVQDLSNQVEINPQTTEVKINSTKSESITLQDSITLDPNIFLTATINDIPNEVIKPYWENEITMGTIPYDFKLDQFDWLKLSEENIDYIFPGQPELFIYGAIAYTPICETKYKTVNTILPPTNQIIPLKPEDKTLISYSEHKNASLIINAKYSETYHIGIYGQKGQLLAEVTKSTLSSGINTFSIDLNRFGSDQFYIGIVTKTKHEILQFHVS
jgi:hypothetical protein